VVQLAEQVELVAEQAQFQTLLAQTAQQTLAVVALVLIM
jgi:hypothetical protein